MARYRISEAAKGDLKRNRLDQPPPRFAAAGVRADVAELVEVGDLDQLGLQIHEGPHLGAGLGMRAWLTPRVSEATMHRLAGRVNLFAFMFRIHAADLQFFPFLFNIH